MTNAANYKLAQQSAFGKLVENGVYSDEFEHSVEAQRFFGAVLDDALGSLSERSSLHVLDCGCGPGAWLDYISRMNVEKHPEGYYGFDLTEQMIPVARKRLEHCAPEENFHVGDVLNERDYHFSTGPAKYDLIMTYDVVQQLPRSLQFTVCEMIISQLAKDGVALIFDNDCHSPFGRKMGFRKFMTRYLGVTLVPKYFCNAKYPPLQKFADRIALIKGYSTEVRVSPNGMKRVMIIRRMSAIKTQ